MQVWYFKYVQSKTVAIYLCEYQMLCQNVKILSFEDAGYSIFSMKRQFIHRGKTVDPQFFPVIFDWAVLK